MSKPDPEDKLPPAEDEPGAADEPLTPEEMMQALHSPPPAPGIARPEDYVLGDEAESAPARPEDFDLTGDAAPTESLPLPPLDPQIRAAAQEFIALQNQAATLAKMLSSEEISFSDYQRLLYESMVQDARGRWWIIDAESDRWYRHDPANSQWEVGYPAALREYEKHQQALAEQSAPDTSFTQAETARDPDEPPAPPLDEMSGKIATMQPASDALYTFPSEAAFADELPPASAPEAPQPAEPPAAHQAPAAPAPRIGRIAAPRSSLRLLVTVAAVLLMLGLIAFIVGGGIIVLWYNNAVEPFQEQIAALGSYVPQHQTARLYDADGGLIAALNSRETGARTVVPLEKMSPYIIHAIITQENERYFADPGFDPIAIVRAFIQNLQGGGIESGASTITQQIARSLILRDAEVSVERKVSEILIALEIASHYDKNFILELYLNEIYFGNHSYGIEAAAQSYFGHSAADLNYAQAALLTSIVPSPLQNDPITNRDSALQGMRITMQKMLDIGCLQFQHGDWLERGPFCIIEGQEAPVDGSPQVLVRTNAGGEIIGGAAIVQIAEIEAADFAPLAVQRRHPHFVDYVLAQLQRELDGEDLFQRGLNIYTTLDPTLQAAAQSALSAQVSQLVAAATGVNTGAVMVTDPASGAILAMVGSHDFEAQPAGQVNNALTFQQPGSAIKPIIYAAALIDDQGRHLTPASILWDVPVTYDMGGGATYSPQNRDREFHGPLPLRTALQNSYNIPAVKAYNQIGNERFAALAADFGLEFPADSLVTLASALGANEVTLFDMMQAYAVFANGGQRASLYAIQSITETGDGEEIELELAELPAMQAVISPATAYLMQNILSDDRARSPSFPLGSALTLEQLGISTQNTVAAKTGTSNDNRDLWAMGFTRDAVVGVWLGTHDNAPTFSTGGYQSAAPVWNAVMSAVAAKQPPAPFENPGGVVAREICRTTGTLNYPACPEPTTGLFLQDQFPPAADAGFIQSLPVDGWSGRRANEFCSSNVIERRFVQTDDASAVIWLNDTAEGRAYAESMGLPLPVMPPPSEFCTQGQALPIVDISAPNDGAVVRGTVDIRGQVQAEDFYKFELLYASRSQPETFFPIYASLVEFPNYGSQLGIWDTAAAQIPNGSYTLRLAASSTRGGVINRDIQLVVDNLPVEPVAGATPGAVSTLPAPELSAILQQTPVG